MVSETLYLYNDMQSQLSINNLRPNFYIYLLFLQISEFNSATPSIILLPPDYRKKNL